MLLLVKLLLGTLFSELSLNLFFFFFLFIARLRLNQKRSQGARDGGGLADQNAEQGKYHVFSTSETVFCSEIDSKNDLNHFLKRVFWRKGHG